MNSCLFFFRYGSILTFPVCIILVFGVEVSQTKLSRCISRQTLFDVSTVISADSSLLTAASRRLGSAGSEQCGDFAKIVLHICVL